MSELRVPLDPCNPGQYFACCGLFELMAVGDLLALFETDEATPRQAEFVIESASLPELSTVLAGLRNAGFRTLEGTEQSIRPVLLELPGRQMILDWWLDEFWDRTKNLKCWAGQVTTRKLFDDLLGMVNVDTPACQLFTTSELTRSKFGVDPRSAWNALDFGFSPDAHNRDAATFPIVEVLAAIGLQSFRPVAERREGVAYYLWACPLPVRVAKLAAVAAWDGLPRSEYRFSIVKRGQSYKFFTFAEFKERKAYYR